MGELMLQCDVVACLLPSFVHMVEDAVEALLKDEEATRRLEDAFKAKLNSFLEELGGSNVLQQLASGMKRPVLELAGTISPLELQAQNLLLESGSAASQREEEGLVASAARGRTTTNKRT
jgi:hypothetical protein